MYRHLGDTGVIMYSLLNTCSTIVLIIFNITQIKRKTELLSLNHNSISRLTSTKKYLHFMSNKYIWALIEIIIISLVQYLPTGILNPWFGGLVGTGANYFGFLFFGPFFLIVICLLLRIDPFRQIDLITPAYPLALIFVKLACFCAGCCRGFEWKYGIYNAASGKAEFPTQLLECFLVACIFLFLFLNRNKIKSGTMYPVYLIVYSSTRFFSEFTRVEPNVFFIFKRYHILCIIGILVGIIEYILVKKYMKNIQKFLGHSSDKK